ncbi:MAG TPA: nucleotidyltransferase [Clostridiales bacterium]|nr:nucleotidyltransferase [Clostridiales bacterium]
MKTTGIICEYNPMHRGHEKMIKLLRGGGTGTVVCLMSGNFVQRGEPAIIDKYDRAAAAVRSGADLVLELPFPWSSGSARYFAEAGVFILDAIGVRNIAFGSESADVGLLRAAAEISAGENYTGFFSEKAEENEGFASGYFAALNEKLALMSGGRLLPNDILGLEYMRASLVLDTDTEFTVIKREGAGYHDTDALTCLPSSTALRAAVRRGELPPGLTDASADILRSAVSDGIAPASLDALGQTVLYRFRSWEESELAEFAECGGGVSGRLCRAARENGTLEGMLSAAATKKYTDSRLRRAVIFAMTKTVRADLLARPAYTSVLASNERGREFLSAVRKTARIPILTRPAEALRFEKDISENAGNAARQTGLMLASEALYALSLPDPRPAGEFLRRTPLCLQNSD